MSYIFTERQRLVFPNLAAGVQYTLPLFLHAEDTNILLADADGHAIDWCEDTAYEADDHRLFWLDLGPVESTSAEVFMYSGLSSGISAVEPYLDASHRMKKPPIFQRKPPSAVLPLSEFFDSRNAMTARWRQSVDVDIAKSCWSVENLDGIETPPCRGNGKALTMDTQAGRIALRYPMNLEPSFELGRLHVRAYFYDSVKPRSQSKQHCSGISPSGKNTKRRMNSKESCALAGHPELRERVHALQPKRRESEVMPVSCNWLGVATALGSAAVGVATTNGSPERHSCYSFVNGAAPIGKVGESVGWQATAVRRSRGWHLLELTWELNQLLITIDGEPVAHVAATGQHTGGSDVWLVSAGGLNGIWGGVEAFHTPLGRGTWEQGVQNVQPQTFLPWQHTKKVGRWTCGSDGRVLRQRRKQGLRVRIDVGRDELVAAFRQKGLMKNYRFEMDLMLRSVYDVVKLSDSGLVGVEPPCSSPTCFLFPPEVLVIVHSDFEPGLRAKVVASKSKLVAAFDEIADDFPEDALGSGRYHPGMENMLARIYEVMDVLESGLVALPAAEGDGVWLFPPSVLEIIRPEPVLVAPPAPPSEVSADAELEEEEKEEEEQEAQEVMPVEKEEEPVLEEVPVIDEPPPPAETAIDVPVQCMQVPSETLRERVERAMAFNIGQLVDAGVELPPNIQMVDKCSENGHGGCFVYRFGTRRLHITTQAVEDGRLLLVVRCGGGFADFYEFATRHARSEMVKLQKKLATSVTAGSGVLRLSSAFSRKDAMNLSSRSRGSSPGSNATGNRSRCASPAGVRATR
jgi:hypothetical protein